MPPVETDADRLVFLEASEFGATATVTPTVGAPFNAPVIFERGYFEADVEGIRISDRRARAVGLSSALSGLAIGATLSIPGEGSFDVVEDPGDDGTGMTELVLAPSA